jgi:hypothetical protein
MGPGSAAHHFVLRSVRGTVRAGKICRDGIYCREHADVTVAKTPVLLGFRAGTEFADPLG